MRRMEAESTTELLSSFKGKILLFSRGTMEDNIGNLSLNLSLRRMEAEGTIEPSSIF